MRVGRWSALGPAQGTGVPWAFWLPPRLPAGMVGKGGTWTDSSNQGHIPVAACRLLRVRRIQPERYVQWRKICINN
jgi:hypothetical protein